MSNPRPTYSTPIANSMAAKKAKIRDQGSRGFLRGPLFPRTPRGGNKLGDYKKQPKA